MGRKKHARHRGRQKSIWKDQDFLKRASTLIEEGILKSGLDAFVGKLQEGLSDEQKEEVSRKAVTSRLDKLVWTSPRLGYLKAVVKHTAPEKVLGRASEKLSFLPDNLITAKIKSLRGKSVSKSELQPAFTPGIGRLLITSAIPEIAKNIAELPRYTLTNPLEVKVPNPNNFRFDAACGFNLGLKFNPVFEQNPVRNYFIRAERTGADVLVIAGGLTYIHPKKASGSGIKLHIARLSGIDFEPEVMDPKYRDEAKEIREANPPDRIVFVTLAERLRNLAGGLRKVSSENGKPYFTRGQVLVNLNRQDEEFIEAAGYAELGYIVKLMQNTIQSEIELEKAARKLAAEAGDMAEVEACNARIKDLIEKKQRTRVTNIDDLDYQRFFEYVRTEVVRIIEKAIPNSKVIAQGTTVCSIGGKTVELYHDRRDMPTEFFLNEFLKERAGDRGLRGALADFTLLVSPGSLSHHWGASEWVKQKERASTQIVQVPLMIDRDYLNETLHDVIAERSPLERTIRHRRLEPGMVSVRYTDGLWSQESVPVQTLAKFVENSKGRNGHRNGEESYIYLDLSGDEHVGHRWKWFIFDPHKKIWLSISDVFIGLMREAFIEKGENVPIHGVINFGDHTQSHNFSTQKQPYTQSWLFSKIQREFRRVRAAARRSGDTESALAQLEKLHDMALKQLLRRGEDWPQRQMEEYFESVIEPNVDYYLSVLLRNRKAGVQFVGIGPAIYGEEDSRDIGVITENSGDHFGWTVFGQLMEAFFYANKLRDKILAHSKNSFESEELRRLIRSPYYGNTPEGYGLVSAPGGYEWGIALRHEALQPGDQNGDRILNSVIKTIQRGDFAEGLFTGREVLHMSGGIHRYGFISKRNVKIISNASETVSDPYGSRGWSPNNTGKLVVGVPVRGPEYGPIRLLIFDHIFLRDCVRNPRRIDWKSIFRGAV